MSTILRASFSLAVATAFAFFWLWMMDWDYGKAALMMAVLIWADLGFVRSRGGLV